MDYAAFLETLKQALTAHLKDGQELIIRPVPRNCLNGHTLLVLIIVRIQVNSGGKGRIG